MTGKEEQKTWLIKFSMALRGQADKDMASSDVEEAITAAQLAYGKKAGRRSRML